MQGPWRVSNRWWNWPAPRSASSPPEGKRHSQIIIIITTINAGKNWWGSCWPRGCHIDDCWANKNVCFSCVCLNKCYNHFLMWMKIPVEMRKYDTLSSFKSLLKTRMFTIDYAWVYYLSVCICYMVLLSSTTCAENSKLLQWCFLWKIKWKVAWHNILSLQN